jgi:ComF family protein
LSNPARRSFDSIARTDAATAHSVRALTAFAAGAARCALPQNCVLCAAPAGRALVCGACAAALPRLRDGCPVCALPGRDGEVCGACLASPPPYASTVTAFAYAFPVDRLLQQFKYRGQLAYADWAAGELAASVGRILGTRADARRPDLVAAVPLAPARQRARGFNQAHEIARRVAPALGLRLAPVLERTGAAPPQAGLHWRERARNVRNAFACRCRLEGLALALVDDVMTTGATLAEAATVAKRAGAVRVDAWVVARTLPPGRR